MAKKSTWTCNGEPKNKTADQFRSHEPVENDFDYCSVCGFSREDMAEVSKTVVLSGGNRSSLLPLIGGGVVALAIAGGGLFWWQQRSLPGNDPASISTTEGTETGLCADCDGLVSANAKADNQSFISQGERILINDARNIPTKQEGARAFTAENWEDAIAFYEQANAEDANDPEALIYVNNARARQRGNPLTLGVVVPLGNDPNKAKEILRGAASAQNEFNQTAVGALLELVIVDDDQTGKTASLAEDLIQMPSVLAVLAQGASGDSRQAITRYEKAGLGVVSPISSNVFQDDSGETILKTIQVAQQEKELLDSYLERMAQTLIRHGTAQENPGRIAIFYNGDNAYSVALQDQLTQVAQGDPTIAAVEVFNVGESSFDTVGTMADLAAQDFNLVLLAMSNDYLDTALAIAAENAKNSTMTLVGGSALYTPDILVRGQDTIANLVLAVPWSWQPNDPFASAAEKIWKGRISWRTTTARDATKALGDVLAQTPDRAQVYGQLQGGIAIADSAMDLDLLNSIPLVQAIKGPGGPPGSEYHFESLPNP